MSKNNTNMNIMIGVVVIGLIIVAALGIFLVSNGVDAISPNKMQALEYEVDNLNTENANLIKENENLKNEISMNAESQQSNETQMEALEQQITALNNEKMALQIEIDNYTNTQDVLNSNLTDAQNRNSVLEQENETLKNENKNLSEMGSTVLNEPSVNPEPLPVTAQAEIPEVLPPENGFMESFTDATRPSSNWTKTEGDTWKFDGEKGLLINSKGMLMLNEDVIGNNANYTVEFEASMIGTDYLNYLFNTSLGKGSNGNYGNCFAINNYIKEGSWHRIQVQDNFVAHYSRNMYTYSNSFVGDDPIIATLSKDLIPLGEYVPVKIIIEDNYADIYVNNEFINSHALSMETATFSFLGSFESNVNGEFPSNYYVRNFKLTTN